jgi:hypothetical protein
MRPVSLRSPGTPFYIMRGSMLAVARFCSSVLQEPLSSARSAAQPFRQSPRADWPCGPMPVELSGNPTSNMSRAKAAHVSWYGGFGFFSLIGESAMRAIGIVGTESPARFCFAITTLTLTRATACCVIPARGRSRFAAVRNLGRTTSALLGSVFGQWHMP